MTKEREILTIDGNEAAARVAYKLSEVIAIYPITPSSTMGEWSDEWAAKGGKNLWGTVPSVIEMQSEAGAAGTVHGALQSGALSTTFTSSQGFLLMIPNMFKIAGELTATVFHVAARAIATHALSIFGDHSDVMAARSTGWAMLSSCSVQEVMDLALIAQASTLEARVPFVHFFDGFRTSHEVSKVEGLSDEDLRAMIDDRLVREHRARALSPSHPVLRGSAQNPDVFFQSREAANPYYAAVPGIVERAMKKFALVTGRKYELFQYVGAPDAERVIIIMGSGAETVQETVEHLNAAGEKVGVLKVRLYRPFSVEHFVKALPKSVTSIAVLDRSKEPGATGEALYMDVVTSLSEAFGSPLPPLKSFPRIIGGRYGLASREFTPAMVKAVFDQLNRAVPKNHFTVGINDDVSMTSLDYDESFTTEAADVVRALFYGLGSDGTVGANKNSIKIIGENTDSYVQGYFEYDSKKSGASTISHLRFGKRPIHSTYLIDKASFIAFHQWPLLERFDALEHAQQGATLLLNSIYGPADVWDKLPRHLQMDIIAKQIKLYVIDAYDVAAKTGMGGLINTIMQTCFFAISGVMPREDAIAAIKHYIKKTYSHKGDAIVQQNFKAVDETLAHLHEVGVPALATSTFENPPTVSDRAPAFVRSVTSWIMAGKGNQLPVSALPVDGTFPVGTSEWEKRNLALEIPVWESDICIQCNKCVMVCPHACIRAKVYDGTPLEYAPDTFKSVNYKGVEFKNMQYSLQVGPEDCTGCTLCVEVCPVESKTQKGLKALNMRPQPPLRNAERANYEFFLSLRDPDRTKVRIDTVKGSQLLQPLFEYSGACSGCGETPYIKLMSQLFGDHAMIANATGCSSIFGGNLPTAPWTINAEGNGPAWSNSLFEDNAEFGLGMRVTLDKHFEMAKELVEKMKSEIGDELAGELLHADQSNEKGINEQRDRVKALKKKLRQLMTPDALNLISLADELVKRSVWIVGGDGWAYDIGYGGLDHVLASGRNVNILVLDTEVYSNTGGQTSKSTPRGAVARFSAAGKSSAKKDLAMLAMTYGNVYVAKVALGANEAQTLKAFIEAEAYDGPSIIIAYSHCIAHGFEIADGLTHQNSAVEAGYWQLFRYNPALIAKGENPFKLDSKPAKTDLKTFLDSEMRFKQLMKTDPERAALLDKEAQDDATTKWSMYEHLAGRNGNGASPKN
jgi:pyruvate-ferredoxin/flavodoxin oxidoreductase